MYKGAIDHGNALQDVLEAFAEVVTVPQAGVLRQNNVDFNIELVARVICLESLNVFDRLCKSHSQVEQDVSFISVCCSATEICPLRIVSGGASENAWE